MKGVETYSFSMEGGGAEKKDSPKLRILHNGINLHFLRIGLFQHNPFNPLPAATVNKNRMDILSKDRSAEIPQLKTVRNAETAINEGYLYVVFDKNGDRSKWDEYQINFYGTLQKIEWKEGNNGDERKILPGAETFEYLTIPLPKKGQQPTVVWLAYSPVQWSAKYYKKIRTDNKELVKRMKRVECTGLSKHFPPQDKDIIPYDKVYAVFNREKSKRERDTHKDKLSHFNPFIESIDDRLGKIKKKLDIIEAFEKDDDKRGGNNILEDMFVVLHDPIGCAYDICNLIFEKYERLNKIVTDVQTGKGSSSEHYWLQMHSIAFYRAFYGKGVDSTKVKKLSNKIVSRPFLEKLLEVNARKKIRDSINALRKDLLDLLQSPYYCSVLPDFESLSNDNLLYGEKMIQDHHLALKVDPNSVDKHLDVSETRYPGSDKIVEYLKSTMMESHPVSKIFSMPIDFDDIKNADLLWANLMGMVSLTSINPSKIAIDINKRWLNRVLWRSKGIDGQKQQFFVVDKEELSVVLQKLGMSNDTRMTGGFGKGTKGMAGIPVAQTQGKVIPKSIRLNVKIDPNLSPYKKINPMLEKVFFRKSFLLFSGVLSAANLVGAIREFDYSDNTIMKVRKIANISAVTTELTWFCAKYAELYTAQGNLLKVARNITKGSGYLLLGFSSAISLFDSYDSFEKKDHDAALAHLGAAMSFSLSLFFSLEIGIKSMAAIGASAGVTMTLSIVFLALAIALVFVAIYLQDSPIEEYLKNCILNSSVNKMLKGSDGASASKLVAKIIASKNVIIGERFMIWRDLRQSFEEFLLLSTGVKVLAEYSTTYKKYGLELIECSLVKNVEIENSLPALSFDSEYLMKLIIYQRVERSNQIMKKEIDQSDFLPMNLSIRESNGGFSVALSHIQAIIGYKPDMSYSAFICQRIINKKGENFPFGDKYLVNKIDLEKARSIKVPIALDRLFEGALTYDDYCNRRDKTVLSLKELDELVKKKRR